MGCLKRFLPAIRSRRRNFGHSKWLGAVQFAAWRSPSRIEVSSFIFLSNSSALADSNALFIHPEQDRIISVREAARLQSFPDKFRFYGSLSE
ncbi:MAG: DNA cytosine methyltransferase, partial [Alphaproteobacteria bacterium]|nr:DNA cytosine methyltransferase [Alphaproteobacteria bacterium]